MWTEKRAQSFTVFTVRLVGCGFDPWLGHTEDLEPIASRLGDQYSGLLLGGLITQ